MIPKWRNDPPGRLVKLFLWYVLFFASVTNFSTWAKYPATLLLYSKMKYIDLVWHALSLSKSLNVWIYRVHLNFLIYYQMWIYIYKNRQYICWSLLSILPLLVRFDRNPIFTTSTLIWLLNIICYNLRILFLLIFNLSTKAKN